MADADSDSEADDVVAEAKQELLAASDLRFCDKKQKRKWWLENLELQNQKSRFVWRVAPLVMC